MPHDLSATIRLLGETRAYSDGAEDKVISVLEAVSDRSDGSDELRHHAMDWPTTYHFSPRRTNLLRPIRIGHRQRILEVGAGTGALTRYLGEHGAAVTALEGDPTRTRAIGLRCADLVNVEVVCGVLEKLEDTEGFDLVVVVGVLEYAGGESPDDRHQLDFLRHAAGLVKPDGALLLAIENQIGLKYLLGYCEDHLSEAWAGVAGYPGNPPVRTFSKKRLATLLERSGLTSRRWFYPFPDYKLPSAILTEAAYELTNATELIDQLVGAPVVDLADPPTRFCDDRASHRVFLDAGLGAEIANSFMVIASRREDVLDELVDRKAIAWHFSSDRRRADRRYQVVRLGDDGFTVNSEATFPNESHGESTWLVHDPHKNEAFVVGRTLEQQAVEACRNHDVEALKTALTRWREVLRESNRVAETSEAIDHPFAVLEDRTELPPEFLDVTLSNFIDDGSEITFIDREWRAGTGVDPDLVQFRALWYLATDLVVSGADHPFGALSTVDDLAVELAALAGFEVEDSLPERFFAAEAELQQIVLSGDTESIEKELREIGATSRNDRKVARILPVQRIRHDVVNLNTTVATLAAQAEDARSHQTRLSSDLNRAVLRTAELESTVIMRDRLHDAVVEELEKATEWAQELEAELGHTKRWTDELTDRLNRKMDNEHELRNAMADLAKNEQERRSGLESEIGRLEATIHDLEIELEQIRADHEAITERPLVRTALKLDRFFDRDDQ